MSAANPYDLVPYFSRPFPEAHPGRLAAVARLFGMQPAPLARARVLEVGCASGGHLLPLASLFPEAEWVGVDLSPVQVALGRERVEALGLENLRLVEGSLLELDASLGSFDYVIAHGVYSWVPAEVREGLLSLCRARLTEHGVAYVSFNCLPGWTAQRTLREMFLFHTRAVTDPLEKVRQAQAFMDFLVAGTEAEGLYGTTLRDAVQVAASHSHDHLLHDHLSEVNVPFWFHELATAADAHGLQYLGDAKVSTMNPQAHPEHVRAALRGADLRTQEQYLDFLGNRGFRRALLVHAERRLDREVTPARLHGLHVWSEAKAELAGPGDTDPLTLNTEGASARVAHPLVKAALLELLETPQGVPFEEVLPRALARAGAPASPHPDASAVETVERALLSAAMAGLLQLGSYRRPFALHPGERPRSPAFVRLAAAKGDARVPTLRHDAQPLEALERTLLPLLDGARDRAALAAETGAEPAQVEAALGALGAKALLQEG